MILIIYYSIEHTFNHFLFENKLLVVWILEKHIILNYPVLLIRNIMKKDLLSFLQNQNSFVYFVFSNVCQRIV